MIIVPCADRHTKKCTDKHLCSKIGSEDCEAPIYLCVDNKGKELAKDAEEGRECRKEEEQAQLKADKANEPKGPVSIKNPLGSIQDKVGAARRIAEDWPCTKIGMKHGDNRLLNFPYALKKHRRQTPEQIQKSPGNIVKDISFLSEFITSTANLFVRTVADVQAMFNVYFTNDADWDDDCLTLNPSFNLFYEWDSYSVMHKLGLRVKYSNELINERVAPGKTSADKGEEMPDEENPWCKYEWASKGRYQAERIKFLFRDPPRGLTETSGHWTPVRALNGTMLPHAWCMWTEEFLMTDEGMDRIPVEKNQREKGWTVAFNSACTQSKFRAFLGKNNKTDGIFEVWRRYDCERIVLGKAFMTFFPTFTKTVEKFRQRIGRVLEDALVCAGRLNNREFVNNSLSHNESDFWRKKCAVSVEDELRYRKNTDHQMWRVTYLTEKAEEIVSLTREWVQNVSKLEDDFVRDYNELWQFGHKLKGKIYSPHVLQKVAEHLGDGEMISKRVKHMQDALVMKAWRQRGQEALFPVPVDYETVLSVPLPVPEIRTSKRDMCEVDIPKEFTVKATVHGHGRTYWHKAPADWRHCIRGNLKPITQLELGASACWGQTTDKDGELQNTSSFHFRLRSIVHIQDMMEELKAKIGTALQPKEMMKSDDLAKDKMTKSVAWNVAKSMLMNPAGLLGGGLSSGLSGATSQLSSVVSDIVKKATDFGKQAAHAVSEALKAALQKVMEVMSLKHYRIIDVQLNFEKVGDQPYEPSFGVYYRKVWDASISVSVPGAVGVSGHLQVAQQYDISEVFSVIYHAYKGEGTEELAGMCMGCLDSGLNKKFCANKQAQSQSTCVLESAECNKLPIYDQTECSQLGDDED
jgi:hypothetical protein